MKRVYLNVPFAEKDEAKALGARWCPERRLWYIPQGLSRKLFRWPKVTELPSSPKNMRRKRTMASIATKKNNLSPDPLRGTSRPLQQELDGRLRFLLGES